MEGGIEMHQEDGECLEVLIDAYGLGRVLAEISHICHGKAEYLTPQGQDLVNEEPMDVVKLLDSAPAGLVVDTSTCVRSRQ
jgi:hypothetical protein